MNLRRVQRRGGPVKLRLRQRCGGRQATLEKGRVHPGRKFLREARSSVDGRRSQVPRIGRDDPVRQSGEPGDIAQIDADTGDDESAEIEAADIPAFLTDDEPNALDRLFVTIAAADGTLPPVERINAIFRRYLADERFESPDGLTIMSFRDGTPYQGEDLIYDAEAPGFLVRCTRKAGSIPGTCLYEQWIETVKLVFRFPRDWLDDWLGVSNEPPTAGPMALIQTNIVAQRVN